MVRRVPVVMDKVQHPFMIDQICRPAPCRLTVTGGKAGYNLD